MPEIWKFDLQILEIQMLSISFFKILNFDENENFFQILKIQEMKNAKIHFSKFEIYMAQSIHGFIMRKSFSPFAPNINISKIFQEKPLYEFKIFILMI